MKLEFTKLETSNETIKVDFGDGNGFRDYPVAEAKEYGIAIPDDISNFNEIKIKGSTSVITSPEVLKSIKLKQNYDVIVDDNVYIYKYFAPNSGPAIPFLRIACNTNYLKSFINNISFINAPEYDYEKYRSRDFYMDGRAISISDTYIEISLYIYDNNINGNKYINEDGTDSTITELLEHLKSGVSIYWKKYHGYTDYEYIDTGVKLFIPSYLSNEYAAGQTIKNCRVLKS